MPRINILQLGTQGVDMKSNALLLGNKKLHAATNLVFDEDIIRTRPGFNYQSLGCSGQFQGAGEFRPRLGLSSKPLSEGEHGLAVVSDGNIWLNCENIGGDFCGDVNIFQAENYLIFQNTGAATLWWDGVTLTSSPGMQEQDWNDPETPTHESDFTPPVALSIPRCAGDSGGGGGGGGGMIISFAVINHITEAAIPFPTWDLKHNGQIAYSGLGDDRGLFKVSPTSRSYLYSVYKAGYSPKEGIPLKVTTEDQHIIVRLVPSICDVTISNVLLTPKSGSFIITNTGNIPVEVLSVTVAVAPVAITPLFPMILIPDEFRIVNIRTLQSLAETQFSVNTSCGILGGVWPDIEDPTGVCGYTITNSDVEVSGASLTIKNTGTLPLTIENVEITGAEDVVLISESGSLPYTITAGESLSVFGTGTNFGEPPASSYSITMQCTSGEPFTVSGDFSSV